MAVEVEYLNDSIRTLPDLLTALLDHFAARYHTRRGFFFAAVLGGDLRCESCSFFKIIVSAKFFFVLALAVSFFWWFRATSDEVSSAGPVAAVTHSVSAAASRMRHPSLWKAAQAEKDREAEQRTAAQERYGALAKQNEAEKAQYQRAQDAYEAQRLALAARIEELERTNNNGKNNAVIDQLTKQRLELPLPQPR
ncbi:MAG: hypothetical protein DLM73_06010 [Chthoniobacterales bacterium]|nr:MAG: hypothetical protein DLM73_06010 [Chthoniobacterales bacterium]